MFLIRKKLAAIEITPANRRFNTGTNTVEFSPDGGATWYADPASDPRHSDIYRLPALETEDAKCDAAARLVAQWQEQLELLYSTVGMGALASGFLQALLLLTGGAGILIDLIILALEALITIGVATIQAAFTSEVWDAVECVIYCNIGEDGQVSAEQAAAIMADITELYPGTIAGTLEQLVLLFGEVLMSNAGVERGETGDCEDCACGWTYCWLGGDGLGDWITPTVVPDDARSAGVYNSGDDAIDATPINLFGDVWANFELDETLEINGININFDYVNEADAGSITFWADDEIADSVVPLPTGSGSTSWLWTSVFSTVHTLKLRFAGNGSVKVTRIKIDGRGTPPASGTACE